MSIGIQGGPIFGAQFGPVAGRQDSWGEPHPGQPAGWPGCGSPQLSRKIFFTILALAAQLPVAIARHGKRRFVILSTEEFEALHQGKDSRTAHHVDDLDDAEATRLVTDLQANIDSN